VQLVDELGDRFETLTFATSSLVKVLAVELAPSLISVTNALIGTFREGGFVRDVFIGISSAASLLSRDLANTIALFEAFTEKFNSISFGLGDALGDKLKFILSGGLNPVVLALRIKEMALSWVGFNEQVDDGISKLGKVKGALDGLRTASEIKLNPQSAERGTQAAFEAVYGVKLQAPMDQLIEVNQQTNGLLFDINEQLRRGNTAAQPVVVGAFE
jgi:hypothetical protein